MEEIIGSIVHYVLNQDNVNEINRRRGMAGSLPENWPRTAQMHVGNPVTPGEHIPMIVVAVWPNEFGPDVHGVNGQALLDGNDSLWVTSVKYDGGTAQGTWHWPEFP